MAAAKWSFTADLQFQLTNVETAAADEFVERVKREPRWFASVWQTGNAHAQPAVWRVAFERSGDLLKPIGRQRLFSGSTELQKYQSIELGGTSAGIPSSACVEVALLRETVSHDERSAYDTVGSAAIALSKIAAIANQRDAAAPAFLVRCPVVLRAMQQPTTAELHLRVSNASVAPTSAVEVYDPAMELQAQNATLGYFAQLGWVHMVRESPQTGETINPAGLKPLLPVAAHSIIPYCTTPTGVLPADFFFAQHNSHKLPTLTEAQWLGIAQHALFLRNVNPADVTALCDENLTQATHYRPQFEPVISAFAKMFALVPNAMPYRSDTFRMRDPKTGTLKAVGTDYFRSALTQLSGDCEDLCKTGVELFEQFSRAQFNNPMLQRLQQLGACWDLQGTLYIVTSAKVETDHSTHDARQFTPMLERNFGLHAAGTAVPKGRFAEMLARSVGEEQARKLSLDGSGGRIATPPVASSVGYWFMEGTGAMNGRLLPMRHYIEQAIAAHPADREIGERIVVEEETRLRNMVSIYRRIGKQLGEFSIKPEMGQMALNYRYDRQKIWDGDAPPLSTFYTAPVEMYTLRPLRAGQRNLRFACATRADNGELLKSMLVDSMVAYDSNCVLFPQPAVTDEVLRCASVMMHATEPTPFDDALPWANGPDALLTALEAEIGTTPLEIAGTIAVDLMVFNNRLDAQQKARRAAEVAALLRSQPEVKGMYYRSMNLPSGLTTGVIRLLTVPVDK